jgi:hypothetical protein
MVVLLLQSCPDPGGNFVSPYPRGKTIQPMRCSLVRETNRAKFIAMQRMEDEGTGERLRRSSDTRLTVPEDSLRKFCTMAELTAGRGSSLVREPVLET